MGAATRVSRLNPRCHVRRLAVRSDSRGGPKAEVAQPEARSGNSSSRPSPSCLITLRPLRDSTALSGHNILFRTLNEASDTQTAAWRMYLSASKIRSKPQLRRLRPEPIGRARRAGRLQARSWLGWRRGGALWRLLGLGQPWLLCPARNTFQMRFA